jgi:hypothetical protein
MPSNILLIWSSSLIINDNPALSKELIFLENRLVDTLSLCCLISSCILSIINIAFNMLLMSLNIIGASRGCIALLSIYNSIYMRRLKHYNGLVYMCCNHRLLV